MPSPKFRQVVIRSPVLLPALSTEIEEREYSFLDFLNEWVLGARGLRKDENLLHLFEWEEKVEAFTAAIAEKIEAKKPVMPAPIKPPRQDDRDLEAATAAYVKAVSARQEKHDEAMTEYRKAVHEASVGEDIYVTDEAFTAGKAAAKDALDKAAEQRRVNPSWEPRILRLYHAFSMSRVVEGHDIPDRPEATSKRDGKPAKASGSRAR